MAEESKMRACDGCTLCCFTHGVRTLRNTLKDAFEWCKHCAIGQGCKTYDDRPSACRKWRCAWIEGMGTKENRPDKTQVVLEWAYLRLGRTLIMVGATSDALDSNYAREIVLEQARLGVPVLREDTARRQELVFATGSVVDPSVRNLAQKEGVEIVFIDTT